MPVLPRSESIEKAQKGLKRLPARGITSVQLVENLRIFRLSDNNVSSPPTAAQIAAALGTPSVLRDGFAGIIDDNGAGVTVWLCIVKNEEWWFEQLTKSV